MSTKKQTATSPAVRDTPSYAFKGYTLDEIRYRRALVDLKIAVAQDRLKSIASNKFVRQTQTVSEYAFGLNTILRYIDVAMIGYSVMRRISSFFRLFRSHSRNK